VISYNTGTTATADALAQATPFTFTIPAGVSTGDVMLVVLECFTFTSASPGIAAPASGGGSWAAIPPGLVNSGPSAGVNTYATAWQRVATASDPGSTFSVTFSGTQGSSDEFWWGAAMVSYTGASNSSPVDVSGGQGALGTSVTCPSESTGVPGDWAVYLAGVTTGTPGAVSGPAGATSRQSVLDGANVGAAVSDSNGSVGGSGTSIGGGVFSQASGSWWGAFTVGLAPASGTTRTAAAALAVAPSLAAAMTRTGFAGAALAVAPQLHAAMSHTALAAAALAVAPQLRAALINLNAPAGRRGDDDDGGPAKWWW
jgi:hypothetical protein